jgi:Rho GTPase-activating protein 39
VVILNFRQSDKMKLDRSPATSGHSANNLRTIQQINQMLKPSNTMKSPSTHSRELSMNSLSKANKHSLQSSNRDKTGSVSRVRKKHSANKDESEYIDNGNTSPLYTNWDYEAHEHLLPLQHYILEQAKLSGYRNSKEQYDSDSIRSESPSEHSLSGNEPDVEDSDHSDGRDYLAHNPYEEYGIFRGPKYYNYEIYDRNPSREDM